jgi:Polysaccharide lyase
MIKALTPFMCLIFAFSVALSVAQAMPTESGTVWFNGRATHMGQLFSYETSAGNVGTLVQGQTPKLWDGLGFLNNDIQVIPDTRYGHVYAIRAGVGSHNPWYDPGPGIAASELTRARPNDLGKWDWFSGGFRINGGLTGPGWTMLYQLGYPSLGSPPLALDLVKRNGRLYYGLFRNAGLLTKRGNSSFYQGSSFEDRPLVQVPYGKWVDFIFGVRWATDNTGELRVYARVEGTHGYKLLVNKSRIPTWQYGTTPAGSINASGIKSSGEPARVLDKGGLYFGYWDGRSTFPTESLLETGMTRSSNYHAAASTLP